MSESEMKEDIISYQLEIETLTTELDKYKSEPRWLNLEEFDDYSERKAGATMEECFIFQRDELKKDLEQANRTIDSIQKYLEQTKQKGWNTYDPYAVINELINTTTPEAKDV